MALSQTPQNNVKHLQRRCYRIDAKGLVLGRVASLSAQLLRGKGKPTFSAHQDQGDLVLVVNAAGITLTGNKKVQKMDFRASGYRGGQTYTPYGRLLEEKPERAIELAVYGMLPKNRLRDRFMKRLKVFRGDEGNQKINGAIVVDVANPKIKSGGPFVPAVA